MTIPEADHAIKSLADRVLTLREKEDYYSATIQTSHGMKDVALPQLIGNLAAMSFYSDGIVFGEAIIAASASIKYHLADYFKKYGTQLTIICATEYGTLYYMYSEKEAVTHTSFFKAKKNRTHDSEYILLNVLDSFLTSSKIEHGTLYLMTERIPCASCTNTIAQFCEKYPNIKVSIYYLLNTATKSTVDGTPVLSVRTAPDFYRDCPPMTVDLNWCVLDGDVLNIGKHSRNTTGSE